MREQKGWQKLNGSLLKEQKFFPKATKEYNAAVEASNAVNEMSARAGKPFTEGEFVKNCILGKERSV